ncbi:unnamed protein product, partial [Mesorhabditis spiculigera]
MDPNREAENRRRNEWEAFKRQAIAEKIKATMDSNIERLDQIARELEQARQENRRAMEAANQKNGCGAAGSSQHE